MLNFAFKLSNVTKDYEVRHESNSLVGQLVTRKKVEKYTALEKINLNVKKGERVGIFGPNGAGKTTLIRLIAGITQPTYGKVETFGKVMAITDLEAGFHPELTGEENIYVNGMISGLFKDEIDRKYNKIVKFADIGSFIDAPFYTYSSGMKFRLAFSVAVVSECDVLLIDELFVIGDVDFQKKTVKFIRDLQDKNKITTVVSSHIPLMIWSFSDKFYRVFNKRIREVPKSYVKKMIVDESNRWEKIHVDYRKI
jgi:ABC-type polysaccharide/polyol phosphate transport system ATPase subunit